MARVNEAIEVTGESLSEIDAVLTDVQNRASALADTPLRLRFDNHWPTVESGVALLSNALLGTLGTTPLEIELADDAAGRGLMSIGIASALKARPGRTVFGPSATRLDDDRLIASWTPGAISASQAMFADEDSKADAPLFGPYHAVFVNPHLTAPDTGSGSVTFLMRRWLTRRLLALHGGARLTSERRSMVDYVGFAVDQLVGNVREHAVRAQTSTPLCLLRAAVDRDEGRFDVSILDTGPGLVATLLPKLPEPQRAEPPGELLAKLLSGTLPGWGRGRGVGLARVCSDLGQWPEGTALIATGNLRVTVSRQPPITGDAHFPVQGTVASVALPL